MDIKKVYVPLDGSERAEVALGPATALAERSDAELILLSVPRPDQARDTVDRYLEVRAAFGEYPAQTMLVSDREPGDAVCTAAADPGALVCMSTRGRGILREALLGSVAEVVVRNASTPVLLVGPSFDTAWTLRAQPLVIAGFDGSQRAVAAVSTAGDLAAALHGRVEVVEVMRPSDLATVGEYFRNDAAALDRFVTELRKHGIRADSEMVDAFDPAKALAGRARSQRAALVAVASAGRSALARAVIGSVALATVKLAPCPVLVSGPCVPQPDDDVWRAIRSG